jgi:hypothetical protein
MTRRHRNLAGSSRETLPAWRGIGALGQAAELLHNAGRHLAAADAFIVTALTEANPSQ